MSDMFDYEQSHKKWASSVRWRPTTAAGWIVSITSFLFIATTLNLVGISGAIPLILAFVVAVFIGSRVGDRPNFWLLLIPTFILVLLAMFVVWVLATLLSGIREDRLLYLSPVLALLLSLMIAKRLTKRKV
jgi:hypothetical protein